MKRTLASGPDGSRGKLAPAVAAAGVSAMTAGRLRAAEASEAIDAALKKLPAKSIQAGQEVCKALLAGGVGVVKELIGRVGEEFGDSAGVKPKFALHGLVAYASRPGADPERKLLAEALAAELPARHSDELKAFCVRQLQWCGRAQEVPVLAKLLASERLCEPATQALLAIGGQEATDALREALAGAKGSRRVTLVQALGRQRDKASAGVIRPDARAGDRDLRLVALYALANLPDAESAGVELAAADATGRFERCQGVDASLRLARRLAAQGDAKAAEKVCRHFLAGRTAPEDVHDRCAALHDLAETLGAGAVDDVLAALASKEVKRLVPAARTAVRLARRIRKSHKDASDKLLNEVLKASGEKAVLQEAETLLKGSGA